jgi:catechol 2,3-dioxygenase-like lactoylglutathione lyase family enzyme
LSVKQLDHLNLSVRDFAETADWYGRVFGFAIVERGTDRGAPWGVLRAGDAMLCIYEDRGRDSLDGDELRERRLHGINHFGLRITDRAAFEATVERERLEFSYPSPVRWPHSTAWYVLDPTGYEIEVACWDDDRVSFG